MICVQWCGWELMAPQLMTQAHRKLWDLCTQLIAQVRQFRLSTPSALYTLAYRPNVELL